jgi:hypothetical protein
VCALCRIVLEYFQSVQNSFISIGRWCFLPLGVAVAGSRLWQKSEGRTHAAYFISAALFEKRFHCEYRKEAPGQVKRFFQDPLHLPYWWHFFTWKGPNFYFHVFCLFVAASFSNNWNSAWSTWKSQESWFGREKNTNNAQIELKMCAFRHAVHVSTMK